MKNIPAALWSLAFVLISAVLAQDTASAQQARARVNYEYRLIDPQPTPAGNRIEVVEFFWYGCPYCYQLQAPLESWLRRKPADVELRRVPAVFRQSWVHHARMFYTLEALGELSRLHQQVYRSHHAENERLTSPDAIADWAVRNGIDRARWVAAFESPQIDQKVEQAVAATRAYAVEGTPSLVVDGRFITSSGMSETVAGVILILEDLLVIARERRATK